MRLYHFTHQSSAWCALGDKRFERNPSAGAITPFGGGEGFCVTQPRPGISFTTNPRLTRTANAGGNGHPWGSVRIEIDGDVLAARGVKLEPYVDRMHGITEVDQQQEILVRQDVLSVEGAVLGVEVIVEDYLHHVAVTSIEQVYDEVNCEHENMPYAQKRAKYDPYETERVREFIAYNRKEGYRVEEVAEFSLPTPVKENELLSGKMVLPAPLVAGPGKDGVHAHDSVICPST